MGKHNHYRAEYKAKIALEALKEELTEAELASKYNVQIQLVRLWKRQAMNCIYSAFLDDWYAAQARRIISDKAFAEKTGLSVEERSFFAAQPAP